MAKRAKKKPKNVLEAIEAGVQNRFEPDPAAGEFEPTQVPAGSADKIAVLAARIRAGVPLWHGDDRGDYERTAPGCVQPNKLHGRSEPDSDECEWDDEI